MTGVRILSNRVESSAADGPLVEVDGQGHRYGSVTFRRNLFVAGRGKPLLNVSDPGEARDLGFHGNAWRARRGQFRARWGGRQLTTRQALQRATGN
jgi:hypothetical protein